MDVSLLYAITVLLDDLAVLQSSQVTTSEVSSPPSSQKLGGAGYKASTRTLAHRVLLNLLVVYGWRGWRLPNLKTE